MGLGWIQSEKRSRHKVGCVHPYCVVILFWLYILGTKEELLSACRVAKEHQIDIIIDAVLNHKLGADRRERFQAVSVNPQDRLEDLDKAKEIEVWSFDHLPSKC